VTDILPPFSTIKRVRKLGRPKKTCVHCLDGCNICNPPKRKTPVKRVSKKRGIPKRVGKLGTVRLAGEAMRELRWKCFERDRGICQACGTLTVGGEMAHIKTKRNNGDTLDNVRWLCRYCHHIEHSYGKSGIKPVPAKAKGDA
jgi:5-methylcytosine-specific restriction endonuclease McrA